jgi:hypothetical protein
MQRLIRYCAGWVMATTLATGVSWVAIQNLVTTAALSQPSSPYEATALTVTRPTATPTRPTATTTRAARPNARSTRSRATASGRPATPVPSTTPAARPAVRPSPSAAAPTSEADVQGYALKGGQVVLELRPDSAALVSAIPAAGYTTETWKTDYWIRVDFANGDQRSSVIVNWYEHPPVVDQTEF